MVAFKNLSKLLQLVEQCKNESDLDVQISTLFEINSNLPKALQLKIPSLITRDYVSKALATVEDGINPISMLST